MKNTKILKSGQLTQITKRMKLINQLPVFLLITITASISIYLQHNQFKEIEAHKRKKLSKLIYKHEENQTKESLKLLAKLPTFDFDNLIGDWTYLNFLQYFGDDDARKNLGYGIASNFFDIIVAKDPNFLDMYPYLSASITLYAGEPQKTVSLLEKGAQEIPPSKHPQAYFLWQSKGTDELLFLGKNRAAQQSYQMAARWAEQSTDPTLHSIAQSSYRTAQFLASNPDSRRARVGAWFGILTSAINDTSRQLAIKKIESLGGKVSRMQNGAFQVYLPRTD
jgi:hypothetical protein